MSGENSAHTMPTPHRVTFRLADDRPTTEKGVATDVTNRIGAALGAATRDGAPTRGVAEIGDGVAAGEATSISATQVGDESRSVTGGLKPKTQPRRNPQRRTQRTRGTSSAPDATTSTSARRHVNSPTPTTRVVLSQKNATMLERDTSTLPTHVATFVSLALDQRRGPRPCWNETRAPSPHTLRRFVRPALAQPPGWRPAALPATVRRPTMPGADHGTGARSAITPASPFARARSGGHV